MTDTNTLVTNTIDRLVAVSERITNATVEHAPQILESVGLFLQTRAIIDVSIASFFFVATPIVTFKCIKGFFNWQKNGEYYGRFDDPRELPALAGMAMTAICGLFIWFAAFFTIVDTNKIISATSPQNALMVAAAKQIEGTRR